MVHSEVMKWTHPLRDTPIEGHTHRGTLDFFVLLATNDLLIEHKDNIKLENGEVH